jgi:hypothetical protein
LYLLLLLFLSNESCLTVHLCIYRPPYRLENYTSYDIRFKQSIEQTGLFKQNIRSPSSLYQDSLNFDNRTNDKNLRTKSSDSIKSGIGDDNEDFESTKPLIESLIIWDTLATNTTKPYAYDHPVSCVRSLQMEFYQGSHWKTIDVCLDEVNHVNSKNIYY